jgi:hypothetical protein
MDAQQAGDGEAGHPAKFKCDPRQQQTQQRFKVWQRDP